MRRFRIIAALLITALLGIAACSSPPKTSAEAPVPPPPQPGPTGFVTSNLILPTMGESAGDAVISVTLTNTGTAEASHELKLVIDGEVLDTKQVVLAGGASQEITFETILTHAGTHNVTIDQVSAKLHWDGPN